MKIIIITVFISIILFSCNNSEKSTTFNEPHLDEYGEWRQEALGSDTVNKTDANGFRQGKWMIFRNADEKSLTNTNSLDSVGYYKDNNKNGYWKKYSKLGTQLDSVLYENGIVKLEANKTYTFNSVQ